MWNWTALILSKKYGKSLSSREGCTLSTPLALLGAISQTRPPVAAMSERVLMATKSISFQKRSRLCWYSQLTLQPIVSNCSMHIFCTNAGSAIKRPTMSRATCIAMATLP